MKPAMLLWIVLALGFGSLIGWGPMAAAGEGEEPIVFNRDIRPILSNNCFQCHGPDAKQRKADLRLDTEEGLFGDLGGHRAVVKGKVEESELIRRITGAVPGKLMPPKRTGKKLTPAEIDRLTRWVKQGAPFARHWSYIRPVRPPIPAVRDAAWAQNPIDRFLLARLEREGLSPNREADRHTLVRRVALDLTGLPPRPEEVEEFVHDPDPCAYEKLVDRLLAKPTFGEHWAHLWLDLARYADSAGYADDPPRTIWLYRDYVIRALNANKPFDEFTIEQLAGDLLPNPTQEQLIATAFHRNTLTNNEGGTSDEEFRNVAVVDRVNTTMAVWMGTTINCAQCHDHKYDPISQEEFFRLFAILNNTEDADRSDEAPVLAVYSAAQKQRREQLEKEIAQLNAVLQNPTPAIRASALRWETTFPVDVSWQAVQPTQVQTKSGAAVSIAKEGGPAAASGVVRVTGSAKTDTYQVEAILGAGTLKGLRLETLPEENSATAGKATGQFVISRVAASLTAPGGQAQPIEFQEASADDFRPGFEPGLVLKNTDAKTKGWSVESGSSQPHALTLVAAGARSIAAGSKLTITIEQTASAAEGILRRFRLLISGHPRAGEWGRVPLPVLQALIKLPTQRTTAERDLLLRHYVSIAPELAATRTQLADRSRELAEIKPTTVPVMRELKGEARRKTHIQHRGNFLDLGKEVTEGTPAVFPPLPADAPRDRLSLARWLMAQENPLTARVIANRFWEQIFGIGIVASSEEFGTQGELPFHPELLDWLATELIRQKWKLKAFLRLLVTSAAYRQSSQVSPEAEQRDPDNRLLARGPRFRLSAEELRDQALAVSGLLSRKLCGPSVKPPQPALGLSAAFGSGIDWQTSPGEDRYRRALYTLWRRSNPYPSLATFDAPNREVCTIRRVRTNTPLQALVTLNDPVYVEAAQALARRIVAEGGPSLPDRVACAVRLVLSRAPLPEEQIRLTRLFEESRQQLQAEPEQARKLATEPLGPIPPGQDPVELAAWTVVGNVLLNLDETLMKR